MIFAEPKYPVAPGRSCGECSMCCYLLQVSELNKPRDTWCQHCRPGDGGCTIYEVRPNICRTYACGWLMSGTVGEEWYPLKSHMVLSLAPFNGILTCSVTVDPHFPDAWREEPYYGQLKRMASAGLRVKNVKEIMLVEARCGGRVWLLLDNADIEITTLWYIVKVVGNGEPAKVELYHSEEEALARVNKLTPAA